MKLRRLFLGALITLTVVPAFGQSSLRLKLGMDCGLGKFGDICMEYYYFGRAQVKGTGPDNQPFYNGRLAPSIIAVSMGVML